MSFRHPGFGAATMSTPLTLTAGAAIAGLGVYAWYAHSSNTQSDMPVFSSFGFRSLRLESTELINHNTKRLRFELPDRTQTSGLSLTSSLLSVSLPKGRWIPVLRPYTPVNDLNEPGYIELMVKLYPHGKQSTHLHSLKPGDTVTFAPIPGYHWTPNQHSHVALIAGGAGITPMYQLVQGILRNEEDKTRITLVWGVNTDDDIFLQDEFSELERRYPGRFKAVYAVSSPREGSPHFTGRVTKEVLEAAGLAPNRPENKDVKVLVCGPPVMEKALKNRKTGVLAQLGYRPDQIHSF
ncbi:hypothetical protein VTJ83DRAFT_4680 [Remersonia thermophila]|uniref:FAD-binding FR-type domain-containing protein n=1 Tax=Remersonia thermophila TaxID=72144 RepID=A0ABR4DAP5_9PEZI